MEPRGVYRIPLFVTFYNFSVLCCVLLFDIWRFTRFNIFQCLFILFLQTKKPCGRLSTRDLIIYVFCVQGLSDISRNKTLN
nr:MAG TPA: hypothetical protein [Caudoviricetes sp.]